MSGETMKTEVTGIMQVHIDQSPPVASKLTTLELHLTDPQGVPIEQAQVIPSAWMTNMDMETKQMRVVPLGRGNYATELQLSMAGPGGVCLLAPGRGFYYIETNPLLLRQTPTNTLAINVPLLPPFHL